MPCALLLGFSPQPPSPIPTPFPSRASCTQDFGGIESDEGEEEDGGEYSGMAVPDGSNKHWARKFHQLMVCVCPRPLPPHHPSSPPPLPLLNPSVATLPLLPLSPYPGVTSPAPQPPPPPSCAPTANPNLLPLLTRHSVPCMEGTCLTLCWCCMSLMHIGPGMLQGGSHQHKLRGTLFPASLVHVAAYYGSTESLA
jgi:hypothetical protein